MIRAITLCAIFLSVPASAAEPLPQEMPAPLSRPAELSPEIQSPDLPSVPTPTKRPASAPLGYAPAVHEAGKALTRTVPPELRAPKGVMPLDEMACRAELTKLGAAFSDADPQTEASGCAMPFPVSMTNLGSGVAVDPAVTINCQTALAAARFTAGTIQKQARETLNRPVKSIAQASGYVCRPRNGTSKLSEHAFGNALDIASFTLDDGTVVPVQPSLPAKQQQFLTAVRSAACGPFKTVLGPGSNADHELHLHFDLAQRRNGSTYCK